MRASRAVTSSPLAPFSPVAARRRQLAWRFDGFSGRAVVRACELAHARALERDAVMERCLFDDVLGDVPPRGAVERAVAAAEATGECDFGIFGGRRAGAVEPGAARRAIAHEMLVCDWDAERGALGWLACVAAAGSAASYRRVPDVIIASARASSEDSTTTAPRRHRAARAPRHKESPTAASRPSPWYDVDSVS